MSATPPDLRTSRPRMRLRRSPLWLMVGVLAVCLGGLGSAFLIQSVAAEQPVLRVNRTLYRGEAIAAGDLSVVSVGRGLDVRSVPGERLNDVVGQVVLTDVPSGSLLVEDSFGPSGLSAGLARVGLRLAPGRFPAADALPGTAVLVVALPVSATLADAEPLPASVPATLVGAPVSQPDGSYTLDLTVAAASAEAVARLAAADRVSLVQQGASR